ncbi:protein fluG [Medicago truncatula]|uniref:Nodulin 6 n=2 Tax=Medicago truncatula TaxID=3880 RepID=Q9STA5_MEDTR|nr:protein fluG [Medicago truncatula]KEH42148.1 nodulin/glutamate-ammonia ligase-like protein [Medicago truncatula]CAB43503.1 nodulin 6 [Medicago truncatula]
MQLSMTFLSFSFIFLCYLSTFDSVNSHQFGRHKYTETNRVRMDFSVLRKTIESVELVDGHAHNLVAVDSNFSLIHAFSLAHGDAVASTQYSLSFKRNLRDVAELYGCEPTLEAVEEYRRISGLESVSSTCFKAARISTVIFDDGIHLDKILDTEWHRSFTPHVARLVRVERLAENILNEGLPNGTSWTLDSFTKAFLSKLESVADEIVGLKSIAAYYFGLDINTKVTKKEAEEGLQQVLAVFKPVLVANKNLVDYIFLLSLEFSQSHDLPMQLHTGFGDRGLNLRMSNPLYLHNVLEDKRFAKCRIVLLHTSYPFSKEASYLASLYSQVYLDFGLAIPKLSVHGMVSAVKDLLEQAPLNKVMFSTDAYAFPELFYLGAKNAREVVFTVLRDSCIDGDLTVPEAVEVAKDLFARNSINFYNITN